MTIPTRTGPPALDRASSQRSMIFLLAGEGIGYAGTAIHRVAMPALAVLVLHATPGQVAVLAFAATVPALVIALPAGVLLDRYPLRHLLVATSAVSAAVLTGLVAAAVSERLTMPVLYGAALLLGSLSVLHEAAVLNSVTLLAGTGSRHQAHARLTAVINIAVSAGSSAGSVLVGTVGPARALLADAASYLLAAWCATRVRGLPVPRRARSTRQRVRAEIREGVAHCATDPVLRPLLTALAANGFGSWLTHTLLAYHLLTTVKVGAGGLGLILAANSAGGLLGALVAPRLVRRFGCGTVLAVGFTLYPVMTIPPLLAGPGPLWLTVLALSGGVQLAAATAAGTTQRSLQAGTTPPSLLARVQQTAQWLYSGSRPLAALAAGGLAATTSVRTAIATGVVIMLLTASTTWRPPLRRLATAEAGTA
ncbi:MFS transporter [Streptomyces sp. NPDC091278]|uniref:MFS transporter n=1 Tax=Streptomyces sp. NPDC091278 TaxID=3155301 RepID=UPI00344F30B4